MASKKKEPFYLGDRKFTEKMMMIYDWIMSVVFSLMAIAMIICLAWISGVVFIIGAIVMAPPVKKQLEKYHFKSLARFVFCALIIITGLFSTGLYVK